MTDIKSTVTAASFGGKGISRKAQQREDKIWTADPGDRKLGDIEVCLRQDNSKEPKIILAGSLLHEEVGAEDIEMDGRPAPFQPDPYKGATSGWTPLGD